MSDWDDKADDHAVAHHTYEHMPPAVNAKIYMGFVLGARWQRKQLQTDEAVQRVARGLYDAERGAGSWEGLDEDVKAGHQIPTMIQRNHLDHARAAITALLGEDSRR